MNTFPMRASKNSLWLPSHLRSYHVGTEGEEVRERGPQPTAASKLESHVLVQHFVINIEIISLKCDVMQVPQIA